MSEIRNSYVPHLIEEQDNGQVAAASITNAGRTAKLSLAGTEIKGHLFESKLLTLFMVRALNLGYQFELAANNEEIGGKFDDLIFRYEVQDDTPEGKHWRYRFLQAKHKVDKTALQIKASQLLPANDKVTDYSLVKYFKSYCKIKARGDDIHDCIICTNIDFDYNNMDGIQLRLVDISKEEILKFQVKNGSDNKKSPTLYKLELPAKARTKLLESDDIRILANLLSTCATNSQSPNHDIFKTYHVALVEENVIDLSAASTKSKTMKLHQDFIDGVQTLSTGARDLRRMLINLGYEQDLANWKFQRPGFFEKIAGAKKTDTKLPSSITDNDVKDFCDKLVFVVNSPSEDELDAIIQADVSQYYEHNIVESQFLRISNEILDWFKSIKDDKSQWLSSSNGGKILLGSVTQQSMDYRDQLMEQLGFHQNVIENMARELKRMLDSSTDKVVKFSTLSPRWTAAKMVSAIETWPEYKTSGEDSYWVMSTNSLLNNAQTWRNRLKLTKKSHYLLLVVDDDKNFDFEHIFVDDPRWKNKVIFINHHQGENMDDIKFRDFNEETRKFILSRTISFQGSSAIVSDLIHPSQTDQVLHFSSIQELMDNRQPIIVPSFGNYNTGNSIYIERKITAFDNHLLNEFREFEKECKINSKGKIQWLIQDEKPQDEKRQDKKRQEMMEKINGILQGNKTAIPADELLDTSSERIIVTGAAGSGKSTVLSHYYEKMKKNKPDWWVIKLNLMDHSKALSKITINSDGAFIDFLVNLPVVGVNQSSFSQSLLRFRLTTGDRIVLMLDGFDEIDDHCQQIVIEFMKKLNQKVQIFITTRPNKVENLQIELSQLSYNLVKFNRQDQIDYLTSIWIHDLNLVSETSDDHLSIEKIDQFASMAIDKITNSLKDQQQEFLGIPLQCRILAECFQPKIKSIINQPAITANSETTRYEIEDFLKGQSFDLASLYKLLMKTKRQVFRQEKMKLDTNNHIIEYSIKMTMAKIESHLTKLAIETIVHERDHVDILWSANEFQSVKDQQEENQQLDEFGISFGLLIKHKEEGKPSQVQFLHRTYAEYLVADYIYKGFLLDEKEHNKLLENERVREWITREILGQSNNNVGEFLDSMFKEMVDYSNEEERLNKLKHKREVNLPNHLQQFVSSFLDKSPFFTLASKVHSNTINFMLDCLDATFLPFQIRKIIFRDIHNDFPQHSPYNQQSQVFQRLLAYYDDASDEEWRRMFSRLCIVFQSKRWYRNEVCWDREDPQENLKIYLNYLTKHSKRFKGWESEIEQELSSRNGLTNLAGFIIHNKYRKNFVPKLFEFLSLNFRQDSHLFFVKLLQSALNVYYHASKRESGKITETLTLIQQLGFNQQEITDISILVLKFEPETFKEFYKLRRPEEETDDSISNWLVKNDSYGMDRLDRAIFYEDRQAIENFIKRFHFKPAVLSKNPISGTNTENDNYRLLMLAFMYCSDKKFPHKILQSLEKFSPYDQLFQSLSDILKYSIRFKKQEVFELILKSAKEVFDSDFIIRLLKLTIEYPQLNFLNSSIFVVASDIGWFEIIIKSLIQDETNGYKKLNDLIFRDTEILSIPAMLSYAEPDTRQKIIWAKNIAGWVLLHLSRSSEIESVYDMLSSKHLLDALNQDQQSQLLDILIKIAPKFWIRFMWISHNYSDYKKFTVMDFMKRVAPIFSEDDVKRLLFYNDGNGAVFFRAMMCYDKIKVDEMLTSLSPKIQQEFNKELIKQAPRLIQDVFFSRHQLEKVIDNGKTSWLNSLLFYLNYGTKKQTAKFIHVLTNERSILNNEERSIWDHILIKKPLLNDVKTFSKRLSNQLGENAVQHLILKDNRMNPVLKDNELSEIEQYYDHLPKLKRDEILHRILATPGIIDKMLSDKPLEYWAKHYFIIDSKGISTNVLDGFTLMFYFLEKLNEEQLTKYIDLLVSVVNINGIRYSIWSDYIDKACQTNCNELSTEKFIRQFLKLVVEKKGIIYMENLVIHHNCNQQIILRAALSGNIHIFEALLSQCANQQQNKLRKTFLSRIMIIESTWNRCGPDNLVRFYIENQSNTETAMGFGVLILYFLDRFNRDQLSKLIELILSINKFYPLRGFSVWGRYVNTVFSLRSGSTDNEDFLNQYPYSPFSIVPDSPFPISVETLHKFLNRVSFLLGDEFVKKLILHEDVQNCIRQKFSDVEGPAKIMAAMLIHVSFEDREGIRMEFFRPNRRIQNFPKECNMF